MSAAPSLYLSDFSMRRPEHETPQSRALEWLVELHARARPDLDVEHLRRLVARVACSPAAIARRGHVMPDPARGESPFYDVERDPHGPGTEARTRRFAEVVERYFDEEYAGERVPPADLVHVTCTGYISPSGGQKLVARRGWDSATRVTHAYHMGCYAAFPALRIAAGCLVTPRGAARGAEARADIVHTELCSLHLDPAAGSAEQLVVQSLFGDGFIRYALRAAPPPAPRRALRFLALDEQIVPDSAAAMGWAVGDHGMMMTLSSEVPKRITGVLRGFVAGLFAQAGLPLARGAIFAVHPGGPRIIDGVAEALELDEAQVATSRDVLRDHGNMSSATLPHIWMRLTDDPRVARGTPVVSLAFGPGLTVCGGLARIE